MRRILIAAVASASAVPFLLLGAVTPANAATTCEGTGCTGKLAANTTCVNDAEVIYQENIYNGSAVVGNIELKYSPSCRATWARVISDTAFGSYARVQSDQITTLYEDCTGGGYGTGCNTAMIDDATTPTQTLTSYAYGTVYINIGIEVNGTTTPSY